MRLKIVSDGHPRNTQIVDEATGQAVEGVTKLEWKMDRHNLATATITLESVSVDVVALLEKKQRLGTGKLVDALKTLLGKMTRENRDEIYRYLHDSDKGKHAP